MTVKDSGLLYHINISTAEACVSSIENIRNNIIIPEKISGYRVTEIAPEAFCNIKGIKTIVIPATVNVIGGHAFYGCSVEEVYIESYSGLQGSKPLQELKINSRAFKNCSNLRYIHLRNPTVFSGQMIFENCVKLEKISSCDIKGNIPTFTFRNCTSLKEFIVSQDMYIEQKAFYGLNLTAFEDYGFGRLTFDNDFLDVIKNAKIVCTQDSPLSNLAYEGYRVHVCKL